MSIVATVHSCSGGTACDAASTVSALVMFGFLVFIAIGLVVAFFGWIKGKSAPPPPQHVRLKSQTTQASPSRPAQPAMLSSGDSIPGEFKRCPDCAEEVRAGALKCRFCDYWFESESSSR